MSQAQKVLEAIIETKNRYLGRLEILPDGTYSLEKTDDPVMDFFFDMLEINDKMRSMTGIAMHEKSYKEAAIIQGAIMDSILSNHPDYKKLLVHPYLFCSREEAIEGYYGSQQAVTTSPAP